MPESASSGTSAGSPQPRRWTLHRGTNSWSQTGPLIERGESVEVMPVAEHERAMREAEAWASDPEHPNYEAGWYAGYIRGEGSENGPLARQHARLREAARAVVDAFDAGRAVQVPDEEPFPALDALRAVLDATPEPEPAADPVVVVADRLRALSVEMERAVRDRDPSLSAQDARFCARMAVLAAVGYDDEGSGL